MYKRLLLLTLFCASPLTARDIYKPRPSGRTTSGGQNDNKTPAEKAKWTLLLKVHAVNNLEPYAYKRLNEMMKVGASKDINVLIEFHIPGDVAHRYKLEKGSCRSLGTVPRLQNSSIKDELVDAVRWAKKACPSEKFGLIFWSHGCGIIDPTWEVMQPYYLQGSNTRGTSRATTNQIAHNRGILFDEQRSMYLDNQGLYEAMKEIYHAPDIMNKKKIDFVGMDACNTAMIEIAYQMKGCAKAFTSSAEFEFGPGWSYGPTLERLIANPNMDGEQLGHVVVDTYKDYWKSRTGYYTQSNINMELVPLLKENMSQVAKDILACKNLDRVGTRALVERARTQCLSFSIADYLDIHSFYSELLRLVEQAHDGVGTVFLSGVRAMNVPKEHVEQLKYSLRTGKELIDRMVTANTTGRYLNRAKGISAYFPQRSIDPSYIKTNFAKECAWIDMVHDHLTVK
ncbi:MAG: clostripain-related cysteine peptidase [Candidatus Dependentiae bacterium]|jgi:hypothetical protein